MVAISNRRRRTAPPRRGAGAGGGLGKFLMDGEKLGLLGMAGLFALYVMGSLLWVVRSKYINSAAAPGSSLSSSNFQMLQRLNKNRPDLHMEGLTPNAESMNAIALDVMETLECHDLLNTSDYRYSLKYSSSNSNIKSKYGGSSNSNNYETNTKFYKDTDTAARRRLALDDLPPGPNNEAAFNDYMYGDQEDPLPPYSSSASITAAHLFCVAALSSTTSSSSSFSSSSTSRTPVEFWKDKIKCPVADASSSSSSRQLLLMELLELFSKARSEMTNELLKTTLKGKELTREVVGTTLHLWAPSLDDGIEYMLTVVNADKTVDQGGLRGMDHSLGDGKLFVDVGSGLGLSSMAVALLYPGTKIVGIEAAAPNWLLQQISWRCNYKQLIGMKTPGLSPEEQEFSASRLPNVLLSGVGPASHASKMAKMLWRPYSTTSTRSWTASTDVLPSDVEITVRLNPWHTLLTEAEISNRRIDVLNVDCEGCEYNLIPALEDAEFRSITTILGTCHWGYIPLSKLPSSQRARETHERMCQHENVARTVKECCAFPDLAVISSHPGEALVLADELEHGGERFPPRVVTVRDVAGTLCDDFATWKVQHHLDDITSDWGWFQISSTAQVEATGTTTAKKVSKW